MGKDHLGNLAAGGSSGDRMSKSLNLEKHSCSIKTQVRRPIILLLSLTFHRNAWVTLLMFISIRRFVQDGLLACWRQRCKLRELKSASNFCHAMRTKMRSFFTSWQQYYPPETKRQSMEHYHNVPAAKKKIKNAKPRLGLENSYGVIYADFLEPVTTINSERYIATLIILKQRFKSLEAQEEHFAATWQR